MEYVNSPIPHIDFTSGVGFLELVANLFLYAVVLLIAGKFVIWTIIGIKLVAAQFGRSFREGFRNGMDRD